MHCSPVYSIRTVCKERLLPGGGYRLHVPKLTIMPGDQWLVTGPSGSGKSTLLDILGCILKPDSVEHCVFTAPHSSPYDIASLWHEQRIETLATVRRQIGYILQTGGLLPFISVRDNILLPQRNLGQHDDGFLEYICTRLGIGPLLHKSPKALSIGERQRVAVARALHGRPPLILADEPTAALDIHNAHTVLELLCSMVAERNISLVLVSHAPEMTRGLGFKQLHFTQTHGADGITEAVVCKA